MIELRIEADDAGIRLDKFLRKRLPTVPTSHLFKMIRTKKVRVNGKRAQPDQHLAEGDALSIRGDAQKLEAPKESAGVRPPPPAPVVDPSRLHVLYEDEWLIAIEKPSGMATHTGSGIVGGTAVDYVRAYLGAKATRNGFTASPAHRLDRETSGVLLVAKRRPAMVHFTDVFTHGKAKKRYLALVKGKMPQPKGVVDLPLAEHQQTARSRAMRGVNMQEAVTRWEVLKQSQQCAFLGCLLETGRTHQIRRHLAAVGHPLAGDRKHGDFAFNREVKARWRLKRLFLHATRLEFPHPEDGRRVVVEAPLPTELEDVLARAGLPIS
jgi:23S rRNA pseudouridine955/2504/2580 synthase